MSTSAFEYPVVPIERDDEGVSCMDCNFFRGEAGVAAGASEGVHCGLAIFKEGSQTVPRLRAALVAGGGEVDCPVSLAIEESLSRVGELWTEVVLSPTQAAFLNSHLKGQRNPGYVLGQYDVAEGKAFVFAGLTPSVDPNSGGIVRLSTPEGASQFSFQSSEVAMVSATVDNFHWENPKFKV